MLAKTLSYGFVSQLPSHEFSVYKHMMSEFLPSEMR